LTDVLIDAALERARRSACGPLDDRGYAFSSGVDAARKRCTLSGRGRHRPISTEDSVQREATAMRLEGWAAQVTCRGVATDWVEHTWVWAPEPQRAFACWGGHAGPQQRRIVAGEGCYAWADCYRCPVWPFPDTAGIGIFAVDGICHQSTNCFLYTANRTLTLDVRGYWFSLFSYGTYGRSYRRWLVTPYGRCCPTTPGGKGGGALPEAADGRTPERQEEAATIRLVRAVYGSARGRGRSKHPHELLADEVAAVTALHAPEIDPGQFRALHLAYLRRMDALIARGYREEHLAVRLDALARTTQRALAKTLGRERYEHLMGVPPEVTLGLVAPELAGAAGVPAFPLDGIREAVSRRRHSRRLSCAGRPGSICGPAKGGYGSCRIERDAAAAP
jgi:hypothetical protein